MNEVSPELLIQSLQRPAFIVDTDWVVFANDQFQRLVGHPEKLSGNSLETLREYLATDFEELAGTIKNALDGGGKSTVTAKQQENDAEQLRGEVSPITDDGNVAGVLVVWEELTRPESPNDSRGHRISENQRHEWFDQAFERHRAPMLLIDPESGLIEDANDAAVSFYGYSYDQLVSMGIQQINSLSVEEVALERERARRESRNHFNFEHELASGDVRPVEVRSSPIKFDDDELLFSIIHDVSEREQKKNALRREKAFAVSALNALSDLFYVTDQSGAIRRWNDRLSEVTGYSDEEIEGMQPSEFFVDRESKQIAEAVTEIFETGNQITEELTIETKSGEEIPYEFTGSLLTADSESLGIAGIGRDISERKTREQNLRQLRRAIEATPHGVFLTDVEGCIQYANPAFEAMTGYTEDEVLGRNPNILKSSEQDDSFYRELWETITSGEVWQAQIVNKRKSGERYHAQQTIAPITEEDGTVSAFVAIQTDITGRKERQQHFRVLSRVLRHNLQNDLSVIRSYAEQIDNEQGAVDSIVEKTEGILRTAQKEREIATILSEEIHQREFDITHIVEQAITDVSQEYPDASIESKLCDGAVAIAAPQLKSALTELMENAIVHNDEDVRLTVSVQSTENAVDIRVCDDGTGIPESEREILETGTEIDPLYHGTGLGLWLVYWIVRRTGGKLTFSENHPSGSSVTISLERERVVDTRGYAIEQ